MYLKKLKQLIIWNEGVYENLGVTF